MSCQKDIIVERPTIDFNDEITSNPCYRGAGNVSISPDADYIVFTGTFECFGTEDDYNTPYLWKIGDSTISLMNSLHFRDGIRTNYVSFQYGKLVQHYSIYSSVIHDYIYGVSIHEWPGLEIIADMPDDLARRDFIFSPDYQYICGMADNQTALQVYSAEGYDLISNTSGIHKGAFQLKFMNRDTLVTFTKYDTYTLELKYWKFPEMKLISTHSYPRYTNALYPYSSYDVYFHEKYLCFSDYYESVWDVYNDSLVNKFRCNNFLSFNEDGNTFFVWSSDNKSILQVNTQDLHTDYAYFFDYYLTYNDKMQGITSADIDVHNKIVAIGCFNGLFIFNIETHEMTGKYVVDNP